MQVLESRRRNLVDPQETDDEAATFTSDDQEYVFLMLIPTTTKSAFIGRQICLNVLIDCFIGLNFELFVLNYFQAFHSWSW